MGRYLRIGLFFLTVVFNQSALSQTTLSEDWVSQFDGFYRSILPDNCQIFGPDQITIAAHFAKRSDNSLEAAEKGDGPIIFSITGYRTHSDAPLLQLQINPDASEVSHEAYMNKVLFQATYQARMTKDFLVVHAFFAALEENSPSYRHRLIFEKVAGEEDEIRITLQVSEIGPDQASREPAPPGNKSDQPLVKEYQCEFRLF